MKTYNQGTKDWSCYIEPNGIGFDVSWVYGNSLTASPSKYYSKQDLKEVLDFRGFNTSVILDDHKPYAVPGTEQVYIYKGPVVTSHATPYDKNLSYTRDGEYMVVYSHHLYPDLPKGYSLRSRHKKEDAEFMCIGGTYRTKYLIEGWEDLRPTPVQQSSKCCGNCKTTPMSEEDLAEKKELKEEFMEGIAEGYNIDKTAPLQGNSITGIKLNDTSVIWNGQRWIPTKADTEIKEKPMEFQVGDLYKKKRTGSIYKIVEISFDPMKTVTLDFISSLDQFDNKYKHNLHITHKDLEQFFTKVEAEVMVEEKPIEFQVGDIVDWHGAEGTIESTTHQSPYCISVRFDYGATDLFTIDGRFHKSHTSPSITLKSRPKKKIKKTFYVGITRIPIDEGHFMPTDVVSDKSLISEEVYKILTFEMEVEE